MCRKRIRLCNVVLLSVYTLLSSVCAYRAAKYRTALTNSDVVEAIAPSLGFQDYVVLNPGVNSRFRNQLAYNKPIIRIHDNQRRRVYQLNTVFDRKKNQVSIINLVEMPKCFPNCTTAFGAASQLDKPVSLFEVNGSHKKPLQVLKPLHEMKPLNPKPLQELKPLNPKPLQGLRPLKQKPVMKPMSPNLIHPGNIHSLPPPFSQVQLPDGQICCCQPGVPGVPPGLPEGFPGGMPNSPGMPVRPNLPPQSVFASQQKPLTYFKPQSMKPPAHSLSVKPSVSKPIIPETDSPSAHKPKIPNIPAPYINAVKPVCIEPPLPLPIGPTSFGNNKPIRPPLIPKPIFASNPSSIVQSVKQPTFPPRPIMPLLQPRPQEINNPHKLPPHLQPKPFIPPHASPSSIPSLASLAHPIPPKPPLLQSPLNKPPPLPQSNSNRPSLPILDRPPPQYLNRPPQNMNRPPLNKPQSPQLPFQPQFNIPGNKNPPHLNKPPFTQGPPPNFLNPETMLMQNGQAVLPAHHPHSVDSANQVTVVNSKEPFDIKPLQNFLNGLQGQNIGKVAPTDCPDCDNNVSIINMLYPKTGKNPKKDNYLEAYNYGDYGMEEYNWDTY